MNKFICWRPIIFFDLETTGTDIAKDRIVQIAAKKVNILPNEKVPVVQDEINYLIDPIIPIAEGASEVHGITEEDIVGCPTFKKVAKEIFAWFDGCDLAGYNLLRFDVPMLMNEFQRAGLAFKELPAIVDVYQIFKEDLPHTLTGAYKHYVDNNGFEDAHDAMADVKATLAVFCAQLKTCKNLPDSAEGIFEHYKKPGQLDLAGKLVLDDDGYVVLSFGKHKGVIVSDVDHSYMQWAIKNNVFGPDAIKIIRDVYRRHGKYESE